MKIPGLFLVFLLALQSFAQAEVTHTCALEDKSNPVKSVALSEVADGHHILALTYEDHVESAKAEYYDDMTYFGYYAETLKAAIVFDYPEEPGFATLFLDYKPYPLACQK